MNKNVFNKNIRALMLEATYHKKTCAGLIMVLALSAWAIASSLASLPSDDTSAVTQNATFQINVQDSIAVAITAPTTGATGDVNEFLRNTVDVSVNSNVTNGFTASMYSRDDTNLTHTMLGSSYYIPTMSSSSTRSSFPVNTWGYSLKSSSLDGKTYGETDAGNNSSTYYPLTTSTSTPIKILEAASGTKSGTQSIYFGTKANTDKPAGTYRNTVIISVVTGTIEENSSEPNYNPITPTNPVTPGTDPNPGDNVAVYTGNNSTTGTGVSGSHGTTVYTTRSTNSGSGTTTTTTEVSAGDNRDSYASAQGVSVSTQTNIVEEGSMLPLGLAATAATAATAGIIFFIIAKRDDDDDEDEEEII